MRKTVTVTVQSIVGPKRITEERVMVCKRTNDPKLAAFQQRLWNLGIKSWRDGESWHAPLLWVRAEDEAAANTALNEIDEIEDDDPRWLAELEPCEDEGRYWRDAGLNRGQP
jgi:hypothetical protein